MNCWIVLVLSKYLVDYRYLQLVITVYIKIARQHDCSTLVFFQQLEHWLGKEIHGHFFVAGRFQCDLQPQFPVVVFRMCILV